MARTSKKSRIKEPVEQISLKMECVWKAGIYARLSVDNNEQKNESIDTQIEIAKEYIDQAEDIRLIGFYTDLGKTGTDFRREGFESMMADVRKNKINCIVVKDFSRFGRNYIETGNYIEKIFPFMKVRFIAVTDGYDSEKDMADNIRLSMNLKNIVNELYAKDIARRVKNAKRIKQEMGSYTGGVPPYGYYVKKIGDRRILFPDVDTKNIVAAIFEWYAEGSSYKEIAEKLYRQKIQKPSLYHKTGEIYCLREEELQQWPHETLTRTLTNPVYIGTLFQARTCGKTFQKHNLHEIDRKKDITVVEHTHEPIISEDLFYKVSQRFERQSKYSNKKGFSKNIPLDKDIFKDKIYCGRCGRRLTRTSTIKKFSSKDKVRSYYYYYCLNKRKVDAIACECQGISFESLLTIIKGILEKEFFLSEICPKDYYKENVEAAEKKKNMIHREKNDLKRREEEMVFEGSELYRHYRERKFSCEAFLEEKKKIEGKRKKIKMLEEEMEKQEGLLEKETERTNRFIKGLMKYKANAEIDNDLIECLIKKVIVYSAQQVEVIFNYKRNDLVYENGKRK